MTADAIAAELETSKRTIYRDIADLMGQRVPIRGEAGVGYVLEGGFDLPPLMLTPGRDRGRGAGRPVGGACAAIAALARAAAGPDRQDRRRGAASGCGPSRWSPRPGRRPIRNVVARQRSTWPRCARAIRNGRKIQLTYRDEQGAARPSAPSGRSRSATTRPCG